MTKEELKELDENASKAMQSMLTGVYSNPNTLVALADIAEKNKRTSAEEIAERAYTMAVAMRFAKQKVKTTTKMD